MSEEFTPKYDPEIYNLEVNLLIEGLFQRYGADFRGYSEASIRRRVGIALTRFKLRSVSELQDKVLVDPELFQQLLEIVSVPTTEMFRDPEYYLAIRNEIVPILKTYPFFKLWIAGCSTGEEVYSMAILLEEEGLLDRVIIYATDINLSSLKKAESGIFPIECLPLYTSNYQKAGGAKAFSDYYSAAYDYALFDKRLKANVVFADHSLSTDSVFTEAEFISCRNVLIYFDRLLQDRVFKLFHASLAKRGFLGLGSMETLQFSTLDPSFDVIRKKEKIYRRKV